MTNKKLSAKGIFVCVLTLLLAMTFSGCSNEVITVKLYRLPKSMQSAGSQIIDKNESFSLEWNEEQFCALIRNADNGRVWATTPCDIWKEGGSSSVSSVIYIQYYNMVTGVLEEARASSSRDDGTISVKTKGKTLRQEIYFDTAGIMVPLEYSLTQNGLHVEIKACEITESTDTKLISVSFLPYMVSVTNTESYDSYLVTPMGSGALSYTAPEIQNNSRTLELPVYGTDLAQHNVAYPTRKVSVNLPVFGAKAQNDALFAVISSGAESAQLHIESGNIRTGHSTVYPKFVVHGYDRFEVEMQDWDDENIYNDYFSTDAVYAVDYYPLSGENACYSGMAKMYRDEILKLEERKDAAAAYRISLFGGTMVKSFMLGIPTEKFRTLTSFAQATEILDGLLKSTGTAPEAALYGFGKSGIDIGEIGGGFNFASATGGKKGAARLEEYCRTNGIRLYTDFNITSFSKSGSGFFTWLDAARTASMQYSYYYRLYKNLPAQNTELDKIRCLKRGELDTAVEKLLSFADGRISGISFSDLGHTAYSDYRDSKYYVKGNTASQVSRLLDKVSSNGHAISFRTANGYAVVYADSISDVPLDNGGYGIFDQSIPFYQTVFRGSAALYSKAVNLDGNSESILLKAVEYGVYPSFSLSAEYDEGMMDSVSSEIYGSDYNDEIKALITDIVTKTDGLYKAAGNSEITNHKRIGALAVTEYGNGTVVYVNYGDTTAAADGLEIQPQSFKYKTGKGD